ncbi:urease accessory protein UreD [Bacillus sp. AK128]
MSHTGVLELTARNRRDKTMISDCYYEGAFKITRPVYIEDHSPSIYLIHVGGGYVDGDTYLTNLTLEDGAELSVTTQSSTKVYKTVRKPVLQMMNIKLGKNSVLEFVPDPLIAYENSRFIQETSVYLKESACLIYSEIITPGWAEDGSYFRYDWIRSKLKVYKEEKLVLFDHLLLEPDQDMTGIMQMEGYTHVGTLVIFHPLINKSFLHSLYEFLSVDDQTIARVGLTTVPGNGIVVRILGMNTRVIEGLIGKAHLFARKELLGKELLSLRKY